MTSEREAFEAARPRMTDHLGDVEAIRREAHAAGYRAALEAAAGLCKELRSGFDEEPWVDSEGWNYWKATVDCEAAIRARSPRARKEAGSD